MDKDIGKSGVGVKEQNCIVCKVAYDANWICFGKPTDLSGGRCPACRMAYLEGVEAQNKLAETRAISGIKTKWREGCGIPPRFMKERFATFKRGWQDVALEGCKDYAEAFNIDNINSQPSLVLLSQKVWGVGKTHLVCAVAHSVIDGSVGKTNVYPVRFTTEQDIIMDIRDTYKKTNEVNPTTEADIKRRLCSVNLLIIDDLAKEEVENPLFVQRVLFHILNKRYDALLPTIITANKSLSGLKRHLGGEENQASYNRLQEVAEFIFMGGKSYRDRNPDV